MTRLRLIGFLAAQIGSNSFDPFLQLFEMRAGPVNLPATAASPELIIIYLGQRLELIDHASFFRGVQRSVAAEATSKWRERIGEVESAQNLEGLFQRILGSEIIAVPDDRVHQQSPVAGEKSAVFIARDAR